MTDDPLLCICGHDLDQHNDPLGYCEANQCPCVVYRTMDELAEDGDDIEELEL